MAPGLYHQVRLRANGRCEYCQAPEAQAFPAFQIDHVIAKKHGGPTTADNLALACFYCNNSKGTDLAGLDPLTKRLTRLFNPRRQRWARHFRWDGPILIGLTAIGRTTIQVLQINRDEAIILREALSEEGLS